jgi:hypothetical protein
MKNTKLGDVLNYDGQLFKVVAESDKRMVCLESINSTPCAYCGKYGKDRFWIIPESPVFQEKASPVNTLDIK